MTNLTERFLQKPILRSQFLSLTLISLVLIALQATPARSQWTTPDASGNINSTNTGNVGIGTASPGSILTVQTTGADMAGEKYLRVKNTSSFTGVLLDPNQAGDTKWLMMGGYPNAGDFTVREYGVANYLTIKKTTGNVGIGTNTPNYKLDVTGNTNVTGNINVTGTGNLTAAGTIEGGIIKARYQDVAEWVPASEQIPAGTVVVLDSTKSNHVIASTRGYDTRVAGVISAQPGITLGEGGDSKVLVATTGRVRVKVDASHGPIQVGDLLVTSDVPGLAMKSEPVTIGGVQLHRPGTLIGKALEPLAKGRGEILVLLSLQ